MTLLIVYVLLALGVSFLCSIMEAVLLSATPSFVEMKVKEGSTTAAKLHFLKKDIDRPLAAILSLNTIAHTVGAAGAGAQAAIVYGDAFVGIFSGILTLLILIISEVIPKSLGASYWRQLALPVTRVLVPTIWAMWPLVKLSKGITMLISRGRKTIGISREEITAMAELGEQQGVFEFGESRIIRNLFRFSSLRVKDIMTPRIVLFALPEDKTVREVIDEHREFRFSRIPIYTDTRDDVTGYVLTDELLLKAAQEEGDVLLTEMKREMLVVPDNLRLHALFERMLDRLEHIALVVDEYGGVEGVVSMEDVVETLLGLEIVDEADSAEDMQVLARRQWLVRAKRLGILPKEIEETDDADLESVLQYGLTGGAEPNGGRTRSEQDGAAPPAERSDETPEPEEADRARNAADSDGSPNADVADAEQSTRDADASPGAEGTQRSKDGADASPGDEDASATTDEAQQSTGEADASRDAEDAQRSTGEADASKEKESRR